MNHITNGSGLSRRSFIGLGALAAAGAAAGLAGCAPQGQPAARGRSNIMLSGGKAK